ncbi:MAG TPA: Mur ligase domain-containing protein, partial [Trueperaceae bacterium]|nr:Mur ligase domain-containing protein [Trueperaceae bacterium]
MQLSSLLLEASRSGPAALAGATVTPAAADPLVSAVVQSHLRVTAGALFVARRGATFDAHSLIPAAVAAGAVAVVGERAATDVDVGDNVAYVQVADSRAALPHLAAAFFEHPSRDMSVVGVTGTDGKTTTSYMLHWLLSQH